MNIFKNCKFHHVGIVVENLLEHVGEKEIVVDSENGVKVAFSYLADVQIEFIEPLVDSLGLSDLIESKQQVYHIAFSTKNINLVLEEAKKNNFTMIHSPQPAKAFNNNEIYWFYHDLYGLIEVISL